MQRNVSPGYGCLYQGYTVDYFTVIVANLLTKTIYRR